MHSPRPGDHGWNWYVNLAHSGCAAARSAAELRRRHQLPVRRPSLANLRRCGRPRSPDRSPSSSARAATAAATRRCYRSGAQIPTSSRDCSAAPAAPSSARQHDADLARLLKDEPLARRILAHTAQQAVELVACSTRASAIALTGGGGGGDGVTEPPGCDLGCASLLRRPSPGAGRRARTAHKGALRDSSSLIGITSRLRRRWWRRRTRRRRRARLRRRRAAIPSPAACSGRCGYAGWRIHRIVQVVAEDTRAVHIVARVEDRVDDEESASRAPPAVGLARQHPERGALARVELVVARRCEARRADADLVAVDQRRRSALTVRERSLLRQRVAHRVERALGILRRAVLRAVTARLVAKVIRVAPVLAHIARWPRDVVAAPPRELRPRVFLRLDRIAVVYARVQDVVFHRDQLATAAAHRTQISRCNAGSEPAIESAKQHI